MWVAALWAMACCAGAQDAPPALQPLDDPAGEPGLHYAYYEGEFTTVLDLDEAEPVSEGTVESFAFPEGIRRDEFGLVFHGAITVPADGAYTFYTTSDDGSRLYIGTKLVVANDYPHGATERKGTIELRAGRYPILVAYFEGAVDDVLQVAWEGPGIAKGPIPAGVLSQSPRAVEFPKDAVTVTELKLPGIDKPLRVRVDTRDAPGLAALHESVPKVLGEHLPDMLERLSAPGTRLPDEVRFSARPGIDVPAYAAGNSIVLSAEHFGRNTGDWGCVVHEMTHIIQAYPDFGGKSGWLVEGIADYIRHKANIQDGWHIPTTYKEGQRYTDGYWVAAAFLVFLEREYDPQIVTTMHRALKDGSYTDELFEKRTGKPLDELWEDYKARWGGE